MKDENFIELLGRDKEAIIYRGIEIENLTDFDLFYLTILVATEECLCWFFFLKSDNVQTISKNAKHVNWKVNGREHFTFRQVGSENVLRI